jgi:hypothetical protein
MTWFNKFYHCPCGTKWEDEWDCLCDDRCPSCGTSCEPYDHEEIEEGTDKAMQDAMVYGTGVILNYPLQSFSIPFIMIIKKDEISYGKELCDHHHEQADLLHEETK